MNRNSSEWYAGLQSIRPVTDFSFFTCLSKHLKSYCLTCTKNAEYCHYYTKVTWIQCLFKKKNALTASKQAMVAGTFFVVSNHDN